VFRLLRLLRLGLLTRRLLSTEGVRDAAVLAALTVLGGGAAFSAVESGRDQVYSTWDGVWWAIVTVTTVGYGDIEPTTNTGRIIVMSVGIGSIAIITATVAEGFLREQRPGGSVRGTLVNAPTVDSRWEHGQRDQRQRWNVEPFDRLAKPGDRIMHAGQRISVRRMRASPGRQRVQEIHLTVELTQQPFVVSTGHSPSLSTGGRRGVGGKR
jgi:hypothetical protein